MTCTVCHTTCFSPHLLSLPLAVQAPAIEPVVDQRDVAAGEAIEIVQHAVQLVGVDGFSGDPGVGDRFETLLEFGIRSHNRQTGNVLVIELHESAAKGACDLT